MRIRDCVKTYEGLFTLCASMIFCEEHFCLGSTFPPPSACGARINIALLSFFLLNFVDFNSFMRRGLCFVCQLCVFLLIVGQHLVLCVCVCERERERAGMEPRDRKSVV